MKPSITAIILTYNEELNLDKCLSSISGLVSEILIVDSFSTDATLDIAKKYGARIEQHAFKNQADQFNWALEKVEIHNEWILRLDADEELLPELADEIAERLQKVDSKVNGFEMKRRVIFMGKWMRHGAYYPAWFLRIIRKGKGMSEPREMDEHLVLTEGVSEKLNNDFIDNDQKGLSAWIDKQNKYATREAHAVSRTDKDAQEIAPSLFKGQTERKRWLKERVYMRTPRFVRAFLFFVYRYILRLGFLDGREGLIFHFHLALWYRFLVDAKLFELQLKQKQ